MQAGDVNLGRCIVQRPREGQGRKFAKAAAVVQRLHRRHQDRFGSARSCVLDYKVIVAQNATTAIQDQGVIQTSDVSALVSEVFARSLRTPLVPFKSTPMWDVLVQCLCALLSAHQAGFVHRTFSGEHVLIRSDQSIAVGGWTQSQQHHDGSKLSTNPTGDPVYMAPEARRCKRLKDNARVVEGPTRVTEVDIGFRVLPTDSWSMGVFGIMLALPMLWGAWAANRALQEGQTQRGDQALETRIQPDVPECISEMKEVAEQVCEPLMIRFVQRALDPDPSTRATMAELAKIASRGYRAAHARASNRQRSEAHDRVLQASDESEANAVLYGVRSSASLQQVCFRDCPPMVVFAWPQHLPSQMFGVPCAGISHSLRVCDPSAVTMITCLCWYSVTRQCFLVAGWESAPCAHCQDSGGAPAHCQYRGGGRPSDP